MQIQPKFPPSRLDVPTRRAEREIYEAVEASARPGRALYEVKVTRNAKQVDLLLWAEAIATFGVQLKGGNYCIRDGELHLVTDQGPVPKFGLVGTVWDSVMAVPRFIEKTLGRGMYIVPVLALPDMEQDEDLLDLAARRQVDVIFGKSDWVNRLVNLASHHPIRHRPTEETIDAEVHAIMPELAPATSNSAPQQVVIHHVDNLHLHVGPEGVQNLELPDLTAED